MTTTQAGDTFEVIDTVAGGYETRLLRAGDPAKPTVLLVHDGAWGGAAETTWAELIPLMSQEYHVVAPDLLGFGGSAKVVRFDTSTHDFRIEHLSALLDDLGLSESGVHLMGNSFGGSLVLRAAAARSLPALSAVSIAGTGGPWRSPTSLTELAHWDGTRSDLERVAALLVDRDWRGFDDHVSRRLRWGRVPGHFRSLGSVGLRIPDPLREARHDEWPLPMTGANVPVLLVRGAHDVLLEPEWSHHLAEASPLVEVVEVPGRHAPNVDRAEELWPVLREFLGRAQPRLATSGASSGVAEAVPGGVGDD